MTSIFYFSENTKAANIAFYQKYYGIEISEQFMRCADIQLRKDFELKTGLKINKQISISSPLTDDIGYKKGAISQFCHSIYINHNWNPIEILRKSKSGRVYQTSDTDIDCDDIQFWFNGLNATLYHKQLFPKVELPFKLKDLSYELVVTRLNLDCVIELYLSNEDGTKALEKINEINKFIGDFNTRSEKMDRKYGVVHNWKVEVKKVRLCTNLTLVP
jgi:hypothetical protein